jgi:hypothetical protein
MVGRGVFFFIKVDAENKPIQQRYVTIALSKLKLPKLHDLILTHPRE